jgi:hypothetical protein
MPSERVGEAGAVPPKSEATGPRECTARLRAKSRAEEGAELSAESKRAASLSLMWKNLSEVDGEGGTETARDLCHASRHTGVWVEARSLAITGKGRYRSTRTPARGQSGMVREAGDRTTECEA